MLLVGDLSITTQEYLAEHEQEKLDEVKTLGMDVKKYQAFCKANNLNPKEAGIKNMQAYLNSERNHYEAKVSGKLAEKLGLTYSTDTYTKILSGQFDSPETRANAEKHYSNVRKNGNLINQTETEKLGLDLVFNPSKSVSIEFFKEPSTKEDRDFIMKCMDEAKEEIIHNHIAKLVRPNADIKDGEIIPSETELIAFSHNHDEGRGIDGVFDPNKHTHGGVAKAVGFAVRKEDGTVEHRIYSADFSEVFKQQLELSAKFDFLVQQKVSERYSVESAITKDGFETYRLSGYTEEIEERFSKRSDQVRQFREEQAAKGNFISSDTQAERMLEEQFRKQSAETKQDLNSTELHQYLKDRVNLNLSDEEKQNINAKVRQPGIRHKEPDLKKVLDNPKFDTSGILSESNIRADIIRKISLKEGLGKDIKSLDEEVDRVMKDFQDVKKHGENALVKMSDGRFCKLSLRINEEAMVENLNKAYKDSPQIDDKTFANNQKTLVKLLSEYKDKGLVFNDGQLNSCEHIINERRIQALIGDAGVGKTATSIKFANDFYTSKGRKVIGSAVQGITSKALQEANIKNTLNAKQFASKAFRKDGEINQKFLKDNRGAVLILDESSMLSALDAKAYLKWINHKDNFIIDSDGNRKNAQIIFVGDNKQIKNVEASVNPFDTVLNTVDKSEIARISENMRQRTPLMKDIAELYRDGKTGDAVSLLEQNNLLFKGKAQTITDENGKKTRITSEKAVLNEVVKDYMANPLDKKDKVVIAGTNKAIKYLNDELRKADMENEKRKSKEDKNYQSKYDFKNQHYIEVARENAGKIERDRRAFCKGEEVIIQKNVFVNKEKLADNGERGIIQNISKKSDGTYDITLDISTNEKRTIQFNSNEFNGFDHSYAISSNKSQGTSYESVYAVLGGSQFASNRNKNYVDASRMKTEFKAYIPEDELSNYIKNGEKEIKTTSTLNDKSVDEAIQTYIESKADEYRQKPLSADKIEEIQTKIADEQELIRQRNLNEILDAEYVEKLIEKDLKEKASEKERQKAIENELISKSKELENTEKELSIEVVKENNVNVSRETLDNIKESKEIDIDVKNALKEQKPIEVEKEIDKEAVDRYQKAIDKAIEKLNAEKDDVNTSLKNNQSEMDKYLESQIYVEKSYLENANDEKIKQFLDQEKQYKKQIDGLNKEIETHTEMRAEPEKYIPAERLYKPQPEIEEQKKEVEEDKKQVKIYSLDEIRELNTKGIYEEFNKDPEFFKANYETIKQIDNEVLVSRLSDKYLNTITDKDLYKENIALFNKDGYITQEQVEKAIDNRYITSKDEELIKELSNGNDKVKNDFLYQANQNQQIDQQKADVEKAIEDLKQRHGLTHKHQELSQETKEAIESIYARDGIKKPDEIKSNIEKIRQDSEKPKSEDIKEKEAIAKKISEDLERQINPKSAKEKYLEDFAKQNNQTTYEQEVDKNGNLVMRPKGKRI